MRFCLLSFFVFAALWTKAQTYVIKDIKSFGAKGNGKTNDQEAFEKAATFFNQRGGNGELIISKGTYLVGKQVFTQGKNGKPAFEGADVLHFEKLNNFKIEGKGKPILKYVNDLKYGAFDPQTGAPYEHKPGYFVNWSMAAMIGHCIYVYQCKNVSITNLELDGNNQHIVLGGTYGDVGRQLPHYGLFITLSQSITINGCKVHHFGLDGISVANKPNTSNDDIHLLNCSFEYNSRQGFSWIGGNDLEVKKCKFNHTGQGNFDSPPGAGVDIEAEYGLCTNGRFDSCEFIDNKGCGLVADSGNSSNCAFSNSTFWGLDNWSIWVVKPAFTFNKCTIYGSIVHGYNSPNDKDVTKYSNCYFEDKPYNGKPAYGKFLIESNNQRRVTFENCTMVANTQKLCWLSCPSKWKPEEKYQLSNCTFLFKNRKLPNKDWVAVIRGMRYRNCTFKIEDPDAKKKGYWFNECCEPYNVDLGGNKFIFE